ncbi:MAG: phosphoribosyltransferase family protein [Rikenellaceae bacterium]
MLTLSDILYDIASVLYTPCCHCCAAPLDDGQNFICTECRSDAPLTAYWLNANNALAQHLRSMAPRIEQACAMFYIRKGSNWQNMIHNLKYRGRWRHGYDLGRWFGMELKSSKLYNTVEVIIPIPLHPLRHIKRGYNQSDFIAQGVARTLGVKVDRSHLLRRHHITSQVESSHKDRWLNMEGMFAIKSAHKLEGKHILLIDDVCTTGATTLACAEALFESVKEVKISIATLATIDRSYGFNITISD